MAESERIKSFIDGLQKKSKMQKQPVKRKYQPKKTIYTKKRPKSITTKYAAKKKREIKTLDIIFPPVS